MNHHDNAAAMVVEAAKRSGLLKEIANILAWSAAKKTEEKEALQEAGRQHVTITEIYLGQKAELYPPSTCIPCLMLAELIDAFDDHICLPDLTLEHIFGEGFCIASATDAEVAPYLGT